MPIEKYGRNWPDIISPLEIELASLSLCLMGKGPKESPGAYRHFKTAANAVWEPKKTGEALTWNPWIEWAVKRFCESKTNVWAGCGSAGKTFSAGLIGMMYYLCAPTQTSVILTSTTGKMVRKRIWPVIHQLYWANPLFPGNLVDSKTMLQAQRGDDKHGIFAVAVREGSTSKAVADIQGVHAPRMLLIIDEATDTPEAIFDAIANLRKACLDFRVIIIGNPTSIFDPHGICATPTAGWGSVSVDEEEWEIPGVQKWELDPGICLHFDAEKSPNVKLGETKYRFLPSIADIQRAKKDAYSEESIGYWKYTRGFWPPEGVCKTVFSDALIVRHNGCGKQVFASNAVKIAMLDPAFGGDKCVLRFGRLGDLDDKKQGIQLDEKVIIPLKATAKEHVHYQIVARVKSECEKRGVLPEHFAFDASGEGGGLGAIFVREWSPKVVWVEFGGAPSEMPVSVEDKRPAKDVYDRKVTELYFSARAFLINGQLKGLDSDDCKQFCSREFSDNKRKICLDTKKECKDKIHHSPDDSDSVVVGVELARRLGMSTTHTKANQQGSDFDQWQKDTQAVYENASYEQEVA